MINYTNFVVIHLFKKKKKMGNLFIFDVRS